MLPIICGAIFYVMWKTCVRGTKNRSHTTESQEANHLISDKAIFQSIYKNMKKENSLIYNNHLEKNKKEFELPIYNFYQPNYDPLHIPCLLNLQKGKIPALNNSFLSKDKEYTQPVQENNAKRKNRTEYPTPKLGKRR